MKSMDLYYVHDPMCSWCYAFAPVWAQVREALSEKIVVKNLLGGLAPDTEAPMPEDTRQYVQGAWRRIESVVPGTEFNFDFWEQCEPRRSTYPACRAVIAAREQGEEYDGTMTAAIQRAYYREARNPSLTETLTEIARELGLDVERFSSYLANDACEEQLREEIALTRALNVRGFPSLVLVSGRTGTRIHHDYYDAMTTVRSIEEGIVALNETAGLA